MLYKKFRHKKIVAIGDVHGYHDTLVSLLSKLPKDTAVFFLGDLIDRGKRSKEVIDLVKNKHKCMLGNHESFMAIEGFSKLRRNESRWLLNGAKQTKRSYGGDWKIKNNFEKGRVYREHVQWVRELPLIAHFPNIKINGRELFLSHSSMDSAISKFGLEKLINILKNKKDFLHSYDGDKEFKILESIFWKVENGKNIKDHGIFNVFGHTAKKEARIKNHYACIDTNVYSGNKLSALILPSMEIVDQETIEDSWGEKKP